MKAFKKFMAKINDKSSFFSKKNYLQLREHVELIEQALYFIQAYPEVAHDIMVFESYGKNWYKKAITCPYLRIWDMLTFYRCIEKLKKAKDYFDLPVTNTNHQFRAEYDKYKNTYYAEMTDIIKKYEAHYNFSKIMWDKFNEVYGINNTSSKDNKNIDILSSKLSQ